jgi:hypothetical protein
MSTKVKGWLFSRHSFLMRSSVILLSLFSIVLVLLGSVNALAAFTFTGDKVISSGQGYELPIVMPTTGPLDLTVDVYSGPNIDIILVNATNLQKFENGQSYTYYQGGTFLNSDHAVGHVWLAAGTYYLIFNNPSKLTGSGAATVHYSYTPTTIGSSNSAVSSGGGSLEHLPAIPIAILLIVIAAIAAFFVMRRKKSAAGTNKVKPTEFNTLAPVSVPVENGTKFCRHCGNAMNGDGAYCPKCGKKLA